MVSPSSKTQYLPASIRFYPLETDDEFRKFALLDNWTPFQAACLIYGLFPKRLIDGLAEVGVVIDCPLCNQVIDDFASQNDLLCAEVIALTKIILSNHRSNSVNAKKIMEWAIAHKLVEPQSFIVSMLLGSPGTLVSIDEFEALQAENSRLREQLDSASDGRGEHHQEKRLAILGFAINALAIKDSRSEDGVPKLINGDKKVNASALAKYLNDFRLALRMPEETVTGFGFRNVETSIRGAIAAAYNVSPD
jgi:hypothetical protein